ncbi:helix-turn-helix domain-containing protein [Rhizobium terrae]|uniref:helix-turn-helix domain-containing protein n=1 Tax=Rhizobium terrae TaxID=2171756 RepID=UPI000E3B8356|nr:helix-turn-helix transcriptional regulator [Rhizobium terrae]
MTKRIETYINEEGLEATTDPKVDRPVYRRPGFDGIASPSEMDQAIAAALSQKRQEKGLSRADVVLLLGSIQEVYGRYERGVTKLHATQVLHLCEVLRIFPDDLLFDAAPHLWGETPDEAQKRRRITKMIQELPADTLDTIATILDSIFKIQKAGNDHQ